MSFRTRHCIPDLGIGVGARHPHYAHLLRASREDGAEKPSWLEIVSENFMRDGGAPLRDLEALNAEYTLIPHGVSLGIGSTEPPSNDYLERLKHLVQKLAPPYFSDHLCWGRAAGQDLHDLLPLPMTRESLSLTVQRIREVQDTLEAPFAIENVSSYLTFTESTFTEWEFLAEIAERADCGILFDVNNVYVSASNHSFDAEAYVDAIPVDRVVQIHMAGHHDMGTYLLDDHGSPVAAPVLALYERFIRRAGAISTLVEWDENLPSYETLMEEAVRVRQARDRALAEREDAQ
jgi:uncharacterized protein